MAIVCILFLAPLVSLRNLKLLGPMSSAAVVVAAGLVSSVVGLAITAAFQGQLGDFHLLPTKEMLGPTPIKITINLLAILPVITMSFVCHYNLLPVVCVNKSMMAQLFVLYSFILKAEPRFPSQKFLEYISLIFVYFL